MARPKTDAALLLLFGGLSLAAVGLGALVCHASGVPQGLWLRNLAAWALGAAAAGGLAATWRPAWTPAFLWVAPVGLALTFLGDGQEGVHRWLALGPLQVNAAMLLLPAAVVAGGALAARGELAWVGLLVPLALLAAQPDASQATALAAATVLIAATAPGRPWVRGTTALAAIGLAALAWLRPDPLQPVPEVEGVFQLAWSLSPLAGGAALLLLLAASLSPALAVHGAPAGRLPGRALGLCLCVWAAAPFLGAFPVPLVGMGMSPILGAWLGVGLLAALTRLSPQAQG